MNEYKIYGKSQKTQIMIDLSEKNAIFNVV